ncbi:carcinoembryonic antigen-related cell adhesion molecule 5-like [Pangasianodon hypophthalmus]|uniref:carcinoembryonic antigen-related cell adhesion molecule 5-like n=1 Tax=Pangasianodon hypophthalmus TaxID=310915 RepID=UPI002307BFBA|nr:carcinoembryonic antigen-related cell adhesion molecule 5-like [Pangasianodon hypophthalmus]
MELSPLPVMLLLISLIQVGQAQEFKPVLTVQPNASQIFSGETVTLTCNISGGSGLYYWDKDGVNVHRSAENVYTIKVDQSHKYKCYGSKYGQSTAFSDEVTLSVIERPKAVLTLQPDGQIFSGEEVTFTCEIRGHADTEWMYIWYKDDVQLSYTESREYLFITAESFSGKYTCSGQRKSDSQTSETSNAVTLTVSEKPKPSMSVNPQSSIYTGDRVTLNCSLQSTGWIFLWYKDRKSGYLFPVAEDTNTLHETVSNAGVTVYQCIARRGNYYSEFSDPVTITVRVLPKPVVSIKPDKQVYRGETVTLRCDIQDEVDSYWNYSWTKDGSGVSSEQEYRISGAEMTHTGKYTCRGTERGGSHSSHTSDAVTLTVSDEFPPVSLIISPSRTQHFTAESLSLSCKDQIDSTGWTVRGYTHSETLFDCSSVSGSTCNIISLSTSHTGVYWCQSESGGHSNSVNITVHNGDVILDSPVHPVTEGNPLTLRCLYRNPKISGSGVDFYKNYSILQSQTKGEMTIHTVSKSDEGFYHCKHPKRGESPKSWVSVRETSMSVLRLISSLVTVSVYLLVTIILAVKCYRARGKNTFSTFYIINMTTCRNKRRIHFHFSRSINYLTQYHF